MKFRNCVFTALLSGSLAMLSACATQPASLADTADASLDQCEQVTGSRIRTKDRASCDAVGYSLRSYSAEELRSTGEMDLVEALRQLDPAFQ